ncbi:regulator of chromosome condensation [Anaeramoeba flamelloides]|uniref:Regulator of chromosome condensation n=1 Tax=Anaeramoeba flamelloides TaxID=1746091 RepID=A0AAV7ZM29_9EUKA|nr:regulator of chromosome condensation [Anaeramoeba flamelloides]
MTYFFVGEKKKILIETNQNFVTDKKYPLIATFPITQIATTKSHSIFLGADGSVYKSNGESYEKLEIEEQITDIQSGTFHFLALSITGNVYSWGIRCLTYDHLGYNYKEKDDQLKPRIIPFFKDKQIVKIRCGNYHSFAIDKEKNAYAFGYNSNGELGDQTYKMKAIPALVHKNVEELYTGYSNHNFLRTSNDELFAFGFNYFGMLCDGSTSNQNSPKKVILPCKLEEVKKLLPGYFHSIMLTTTGKLHGSGTSPECGNQANSKEFAPVLALKDKNIVNAAVGFQYSIALDSDGYLYYFGARSSTNWEKMLNVQKSAFRVEEEISQLMCGYVFQIFLKVGGNSLEKDISSLQSGGEGYPFDTSINGVGAHKLLLELRTKKPLNEIANSLQDCTKNDIEVFFSWVYTNIIYDRNAFEHISKKLQLGTLNGLSTDFAQLYDDEDSKDFKILVKDPDEDDENDDEDDEDEEGGFEEIPVHKLLLQARSGLFREMFKNITNKSNKVTDYSGKSIESLELFIKYLYTGDIQLTADDDPELIIEELEDAAEYYQLTDQNQLQILLNSLK